MSWMESENSQTKQATSSATPYARNLRPLKANDESRNDYRSRNNAQETLESGNEHENQRERTQEKTACSKQFATTQKNTKPVQSLTMNEIQQRHARHPRPKPKQKTMPVSARTGGPTANAKMTSGENSPATIWWWESRTGVGGRHEAGRRRGLGMGPDTGRRVTGLGTGLGPMASRGRDHSESNHGVIIWMGMSVTLCSN